MAEYSIPELCVPDMVIGPTQQVRPGIPPNEPEIASCLWPTKIASRFSSPEPRPPCPLDTREVFVPGHEPRASRPLLSYSPASAPDHNSKPPFDGYPRALRHIHEEA